MLNQVTLLGRLAQTPEIKSTPGGKAVTRFDLAVQVPTKNKDTPPDYFTIVCWEEKADFVRRYLSKGSQIVVTGRLVTRKWEDKHHQKRKEVEVKASNLYFADSNTGAGNAEPQNGGFTNATNDFTAISDTDDDLPF